MHYKVGQEESTNMKNARDDREEGRSGDGPTRDERWSSDRQSRDDAKTRIHSFEWGIYEHIAGLEIKSSHVDRRKLRE